MMQVDAKRQQYRGDEHGDSEQESQHVVVDHDEHQQSKWHP